MPVRDFDLHPDEDDVRVFVTEPGGVLRIDDDAYVSAGRYGDVILWHYAFARHWFKVNLTTQRSAGHTLGAEQPEVHVYGALVGTVDGREVLRTRGHDHD